MANMPKTHLNGQPFNGLHDDCGGGGGSSGRKDPLSSSSSSSSLSSSAFVNEELLPRLENLLDEFFFPNTSNDRKREIETTLAEFSSLPDSWQMSFHYFARSQNEYTKMFCLTVIETFINQRWHTMPIDVRTTFRVSLWSNLVERHTDAMTAPIRNKFCKILVSIARFDWPYAYPDYLTNVLELLSAPDTSMHHNVTHSSSSSSPSSLILLGLNLLGMTVEDLTSSSYNYHFSSNRQIELIKLIESNLPAMLHALTSLLEMIISKHINFIAATPPPSPTNSPTDSFSSIPKANDTLNSVFQMSIKKGLLKTIPDMDAEFVQMTSQIFTSLSRIIAFMPVTYYANINNTLLSALYVFATFGSINPSYNSAKLGLASMGCINELMSKASAFNSDANEFIYNVFHNTFLILQRIITTSLKQSPNGGDRSPPLDERIDDDYLKKFIDFLKLFINGHLGRFEKFISFPTNDFLGLLLEFTTKMHHSLECYLMLLETWSIYLDYLESCLNVKHKDKTAIAEKLQTIKEPIMALLLFALRSIQYSCNREYLQQLDDCTLDDDNRTEFEQYVQTSIEIIAKIGEIYPDETIVFIDSNYFNEKLRNIHYGLEFFVNNNNKSLTITNGRSHHHYHHSSGNNNKNAKLFPIEMCQQPLAQLQLSIHDFITTLQVCSRFSNSFVDEFFERYFARTKLIFDKLLEILQFLYHHHCCDSIRLNALSGEFFLLKAQLLATFKAYIVWFQQLYCNAAAGSVNAEQKSSGDRLLTIIFNTCCSIVCDTSLLLDNDSSHGRHISAEISSAKRKLFHSAALTLNTFSANVRPPMVFALESVQRLFDQTVLAAVLQLCDINSNINRISGNQAAATTAMHDRDGNHFAVSLTDQILISQSISNLLILPWFAAGESQEWERRSHCFNIFIGNFLQLFNKLNFDNAQSSNTINSSSGGAGGGGGGVMGDISKLSATRKFSDRHCPNVFCRSLYILRKVIKSHADSPIKSKQLLWLSLESSLDAFRQLLVHNAFLHSTVIGCQITEHILALFLVVFDVLLAQVHIDFVKQTIQTLLQIIHTHDILSSPVQPQQNADHVAGNTFGGTPQQTSALKVIIKFLKLLCLIIKQTSFNSVLRPLLPGIIDFTVISIQSNLINAKSTAGVYYSGASGTRYDTYSKLLQIYYRFLHELMLNNCRYFFPQSSVNKLGGSFGGAATDPNTERSSGGGGGPNGTVAVPPHQRHFHDIMEIIGQSFMQPENIQLYRQNVEALESLNETIKLYSRPAFRSTFHERFLYLFMQMLLDRSLDLLDELLYTIVYRLAEVDFNHFYDSFVLKFLTNVTRQLNDHQRAQLVTHFNVDRQRCASAHEAQIDFPTFSANLNRLLCDIRFYHKCNSVVA